jgi:hypothetical protein
MLVAAILVSGTAVSTVSASSDGPGWLGVVVARGELKEQIENTPILERPNRPFHFYGNTVRRQYYRGTALPAPRDFVQGGAALVKREKQ